MVRLITETRFTAAGEELVDVSTFLSCVFCVLMNTSTLHLTRLLLNQQHTDDGFMLFHHNDSDARNKVWIQIVPQNQRRAEKHQCFNVNDLFLKQRLTLSHRSP